VSTETWRKTEIPDSIREGLRRFARAEAEDESRRPEQRAAASDVGA
jgi:hypothetical protein